MGIAFWTDEKMVVEFVQIIFEKNYSLIISGNLQILMKYSFINNCIIVVFQKKNNYFPVAPCD